MQRVFTLVITCAFLLLLTNCENNSADPDTRSTTLAEAATPPADTMASSIPVFEEPKAVELTVNGSKSTRTKTEKKIDKVIERSIMDMLRDDEIGGLDSLAGIYDQNMIKIFTQLAGETGGEAYMIGNAGLVVQTIAEVLTDHLGNGTDLVFCIDKTGSMSDDIAAIRTGLGSIINLLEGHSDMRIGFAFYGDRFADGRSWFNYVPLDNDIAHAKQVIQDLQVTGGGGAPESVYDGVALTMDTMNWNGTAKRIMLLIGDAPSLEKPYARYTLEDIIAKANAENVRMNFYPIIISFAPKSTSIYKPTVIKADPEELIDKLAPNPADHIVGIKTHVAAAWSVSVYDQAGRMLKQDMFSGDTYMLYVDDLPSGSYYVRLFDPEKHTVDVKVLVVQH